MDLTKRGKIFLIITLLSFAFSYLLITLNFFPHFGASLSFTIFIGFAYKLKKEKDMETQIYFIFVLIFSAFIFIRSEPFITFLNLLAAMFFTLLMCVPGSKRNLAFLDYMFAMFSFAIRSIFVKESDYYPELKDERKRFGSVKMAETLFGILVSLVLVAIVLPLLSSANPIFKNIISNIFKYIDLKELLEYFGYENIFIWTVRTIFFFIFIFFIPKVLTVMNRKNVNLFPIKIRPDKLSYKIPQIVLSVIIFIFFLTQIQYYLASDDLLSSMGVSHSERTREVFAQLSLVAGIILALIYNAQNKDISGKILNWTLGIQGIFLTFMAYKSVFEYIDAWGLTYKRLYGLTFATWIMGIFILFFINYKRRVPSSRFVGKTIIFSSVLLIFLNILNFDYLIYHFSRSKTGQGIDYTYLSSLSSDSLSYKEQFLKLQEVTVLGVFPVSGYDNRNPLIILYKIEELQRKYEKFDLRTMSLLDFFQYRQIRSIDTASLRSYYKDVINPRNLL